VFHQKEATDDMGKASGDDNLMITAFAVVAGANQWNDQTTVKFDTQIMVPGSPQTLFQRRRVAAREDEDTGAAGFDPEALVLRAIPRICHGC
jgi:hypothetical protein